jgi:Lipoprotein LpqB beta-propeller domain/Sporulation and spore germination
MSSARRHLVDIIIVIASVFAAAGCVSVPTSGPIEKVEGPQPGCQNCVNVEVKPPAPGDEPKKIVEGYLRATSNYQPNYSVARQFLTRMAAEKWSPETGVWIYRGFPKAAPNNTVLLDAWQVGTLGPDRAYTANNKPLKINFKLTEEHGEWRISNPPPRLLVAEFSFKSFYQSYDRYFVGNSASLVPDPIYLPALSNPANVASALIKALLSGPSSWLRSAVTTAVPPNTSLSVDSVTITNGIAEVPLSDSVMALPDKQRGWLAAQIVYTLRQIGGIKGVLIKVNQQPYRVPGSDPNSLVISIDAIPQEMDPVPFVAGEQLYAVQGGKIKRVTATSDSPAVENLTGPLTDGRYPVNALAVSVANTDFAATTNDRTMLRLGPITSEEQPTTLLKGVSGLLRPQFTRYGEIWAIGQQGNRQQVWMFSGDGKKITPHVVDAPEVNGKVKAFKISPDGTRIALVREIDKNKSDLVLATIIRSEKIMISGWHRLDIARTSLPAIDMIRDVAWLNATELLVLGAGKVDTVYAPYRVAQDASQISGQGNAESWNAVELAVSPRRQTAIIIGQQGHTWRDNGSQWLPFLNGVNTVAYPG